MLIIKQSIFHVNKGRKYNSLKSPHHSQCSINKEYTKKLTKVNKLLRS